MNWQAQPVETDKRVCDVVGSAEIVLTRRQLQNTRTDSLQTKLVEKTVRKFAELRTYCQRAKCSTWTLVSGDKTYKFYRVIRWGFPEE